MRTSGDASHYLLGGMNTYSLVSVTTSLLDLRPKDVLVLLMVLIIAKEPLLLVDELVVLHWADLGVPNCPHVQNLSVGLEIHLLP